MTTAADPDRIQGFDGIRGVSVLAIVGMHAAQVLALVPGLASWGVPLGQPIDEFARKVVLFGWSFVDVFFVLSGYLITGILLRSKDDPHYFRNFYARRVLRIFPLYYLVVCVRLYVLPLGGASYPIEQQLAHLTFLSNIWFASFVDRGVDDPSLGLTWSLAIEEHFYLLWPLLVAVLSRRNLLRACVGIVIGGLLLRIALVLGGTPWRFVWLFTFCRIDTLALGALLAIVGQERVRWLPAWLLLAVAGQGTAIGLGNTWPSSPWMQTLGYSSNALLGAALVVLAQRGGVATRIFCQPWLRRFGQHSYAIYLSHHLVIEWLLATWLVAGDGYGLRRLAQAFGCFLPAVIAFIVACAIAALVVGWLLWHVVEQPFLRLRRHFVQKEPPRSLR